MKAKQIEPEIKAPPTPRERAERYRQTLSTLQNNEDLAKRRAAKAKAQFERELIEAETHTARLQGARKELERLEGIAQ